MKNGEIQRVLMSYFNLSKEDHETKLPMKVAWNRRVNLEKMIKANELIVKAAQEIDEKYKPEIQNDGTAKVPEEKFKELDELMDQETDIEIKKVSFEDLGDAAVSDAFMDTLRFMIKEDEGGEANG